MARLAYAYFKSAGSVRSAVALTLCGTLTTACLGLSGSGGGSSGSGADDTTGETGTSAGGSEASETADRQDLDPCANGYGDAEISDTVQIVDDFEDSAHEMIACGGLVFSIVGALISGAVELVEDPSSSTLPEQYTYDGAGTYHVDVQAFQDVRMDVKFHLARDYAFGKAGDLVTENLFSMSSYLKGARSTLVSNPSNPLDVTVEIDYDEPGPLVELLGYGATPPNPLVLDAGDLDTLGGGLAGLEVDATIFFTDHPGVSTIEYDVESPRMLASSIFSGAAMQLDMVNADGRRLDLNQDLDVHTWTVEYADGVGALIGDIGFIVRGDRFDFEAQLHYDSSGWPQTSITCAP